MKKYNEKDPIVDHIMLIETCPSCGWTHKGEEKIGIPVRQDRYKLLYIVCQMTKDKIPLSNL